MRAERVVSEIAVGGVARWRDVAAAGASDSALSRAVERGRVRRVARGLYSTAQPDPLIIASHVGVLSHRSAALVLGMDLVDRSRPVEVTVRDARARPPDFITCHRSRLGPGDVVEIGQLQVTSPLRTIADLARRLPRDEAVVATDSALRARLVTASDVHELGRAARGPGAGRLRVVGNCADARSESALETLLRLVMADAGLTPLSQVPIGDDLGTIARVDFLFDAERVVVEADGFAFHSSRESLRTDVRRANALQELGYRILRFTWEDVVGRARYVVSSIHRTLSAARG